VDRSGEYRVVPALLALIGRLSAHHDLEVFALNQEPRPGEWHLAGAHIHNVGGGHIALRAVSAIRAIRAAHRAARFDVLHAIWSGWGGLVVAASGRMLRIPSVVHIAGGELVALPEIGYGGALRWHGRLREAWTLRTVCAITAASAPIVERLSELGFQAQRVPLGVDLRAWPRREPVRRDMSRPARLIHVASLNRVKDQTTLLRALASLAKSGVDFEMEVVGEDILQGAIQRLSVQCGLAERVSFRGFLTQRELRPLLERADLMVLSSRHETGPLVMLEAAVAGVPTVGTAVGHIREWSPEAALSVPVGGWAELAEAIRRVLGDEELRLRLAREAQRRALREDADHTAECFLALYSRLCTKSPPPRA